MLLLIYSFVLDIAMLLFIPFNLIPLIYDVLGGEKENLVKMIIGCVGYVLMIVFLFIMWAFIKYHFELVDKNKTTIEHLDEKRGNIANVTYDMGEDFNWKFVFGSYKACWLFPYDKGIGASMGDGVVISKRDLNPKESSFNLDDFDKNFDNQDKSWNKEDLNDPLNKLVNGQNSKGRLTNPFGVEFY